EIRNAIANRLETADSAVYEVLQHAVLMLRDKTEPVFRERAEIVTDVCRRLVGCLQGHDMAALELSEPAIVCAKELTPSEMIHLNPEKLLGVVLDEGGETSHAAILTRLFGVPAIVGMKNFSQAFDNGTPAIINGNSGKIIIHPDDETLAKYQRKIEKFQKYRQQLENIRDTEAITKDGVRIYLHANIELPIELKAVHNVNADGVGLFRTEYLYLSQEVLPSEEEQYRAYREVAEALSPKPVVIRTFDLGGDKIPSGMSHHREPNPFMGWRAIRVSLARPELFRIQLRAIARAAVYGNISIMFPMVIGLGEFRTAKEMFLTVCNELARQHIPHNCNVPIGVMIEVPSAAILVDLFAREADFLSIGTNDLTQFTLAVDRSNPFVTDLYQPFHLSVLRLIQQIIDSGNRANCKVSICGELGGNSVAAPLLIGMGMRHFSMSPMLIPEIKAIVQATTVDECKQTAETVFSLATSQEITDYLRQTIRKRFADLPIWFGR
ncbi:MAG: phosphoenolpyruvate--protein phosphotransferase, partial [bacterium]|nr:phosphoenolpyruvate--protein phosphotransferase [bacterium]